MQARPGAESTRQVEVGEIESCTAEDGSPDLLEMPVSLPNMIPLIIGRMHQSVEEDRILSRRTEKLIEAVKMPDIRVFRFDLFDFARELLCRQLSLGLAHAFSVAHLVVPVREKAEA